MILKKNDLQNFVSFLTSDVNVFFLYGANFGLIDQLSSIIFSTYQAADKYIMVGSEVIKQPGVLVSKLTASDFFEEKKTIVKIYEYNQKCFKVIQDVAKYLSPLKKIILIASESDTKDQINQIGKSDNSFLLVPCYLDEIGDAVTICKKFFLENEISVSNQFADKFASLLFGDRMILMNELQKILLFLSNKHEKALDEEYLENIYDSALFFVDELIDEICLKRPRSFALLNKLLKSDVEFFNFLRALQRHLDLIYHKLCRIELRESSIDEELKYIFFKRIGSMKSQLLNLSAAEVNSLMKQVLQIEVLFLNHGEEFAVIDFKAILLNFIARK